MGHRPRPVRLTPAHFFARIPLGTGAVFGGAGPMNNEQVQVLTRMVRAQEDLELHREAELRAIAHGLIQGHLGRSHRIINIQNFYSALVRALIAARAQAQADCSGETVVTLA